ncbi:hypothetical protein DICPUDRAFT_29604, partial [Dictyostelium purpureum]
GIEVLNSTISKKEINLFGNYLEYSVFEFTLDSDIFKYDSLACPSYNCNSPNTGIDCSCDYTNKTECPKKRDVSCTNECLLVDENNTDLCGEDLTWTTVKKDQDYIFESDKTLHLRYKADSSICEGIMVQNYPIEGFYKFAMGRSLDYNSQRDCILGNPLIYGVMNICPSDNVDFLEGMSYNQGWTDNTYFITIVPFVTGKSFKKSFRLTSKPVPAIPNPLPACSIDSQDPILSDHQCLSDGIMVQNNEKEDHKHDYYVFKAKKSAIHTIRSPSLYETPILLADDKQKKPSYNSIFQPPKWGSRDEYENSITMYLEKDQVIYISVYTYWASPYVLSITSDAFYSQVNVSTLPSKAAMFSLVKSSRILNSNTIVSCEQWSQCFLYTIGPPYSNNDPTSPLPPPYLGYFIQDSLPSYYELNYDDTLLNPLKRKVYQAAFLMSYKIGSATKSTLVTWEDLKNTKIEFLSTHFDADGIPLSGIVSNYTVKDYECSYNELNVVLNEIDRIEELLYNVTDLKEMNNYRYQLDTLTIRDSYVGCTHKATTLLEKRTVEKNVTGTFCQYSTNDSRFFKDPCCSLVMRYSECCNPTTKLVEQEDYVGVYTDSVRDQCSNPSCTETVVDQYYSSLGVQDDCSVPRNALDNIKIEIITVLRQCQADVVLDTPTCSSDQECKTFSGPNGVCDMFTRKCLPDFQFIDKRYLTCIFSQLDQATIFKLLHKPFSLNDTIIQELYNYYQSEDCINQGTFTQRQIFQYLPKSSSEDIYSSPHCLDDSCPLVHDVYYDGVYSYYKQYIYQDFTNCELFGICNSNPACYGVSSTQTCASDCNSNGDFCGYCSNSTDALCYNFNNNDQVSCTSSDYCIVGNNQFEENLSQSECEESGVCDIPCGYSCDGFVGCALINVPNEEICLSVPLTSWDMTYNICKYDVATQDQCTGSDQLGWIDCTSNLMDECSGPTLQTINACSLKPKECATKSECEAAGQCSDSYFFLPENTKYYPAGLGKCVKKPDLYINQISCLFSRDITLTERDSPMGCFTDIPSVFSRAECERLNYTWWSPATSMDQCLGLKGCKIYPPEETKMLPYNTQFNQMNEGTCLGCYDSNNEWSNKFEWKNGSWKPGVYVKGQWIQSKWISTSIHTTSLSYQRIYDDLMISANTQMSDLLRSEYFCRSFRTKNNLDSISCSCSSNGNGGSECFKETSLLLGQTKPCNNKQSNYTFDYGQILFSEQSVQEGCGNVLVSQFPYQLFTSSEQSFFPSNFVSYPKPDKYGVFNDKEVIVGTILGDGISVESQGVDRFTVCFVLGSSIGNSEKYPVLDIASQNEIDQKVYPLDNTNASIVEIKGNSYLCSHIDNIKQKGTYFPINRVENWKSQGKQYFDRSTEGLLYTLAALFLLVALYGFYQLVIIMVVRFRNIITRFELVHLLILMVFIFLTVRMVYFFLLPKGYLADSAIADYSLVVLPTFFYFSCFTIILVLWFTIVFLVLKNNASVDLSKRVSSILVIVNVLIYLLLIAIIVAFQYTKNDYTNNCGNRIIVEIKNSSSQKAVSIVYATVQAVISITIASLFIYLGGSLYMAMRKSLNSNSNSRALKKTKKIFLLTAVCSVGFILHCVFILVLVGIENPSVTFSFIGLVITEIIPSLTILYCYDQRVSLSLDRTLSIKSSTSSISDKTDSKLTTITSTEKTFSENLSSEF